MQPLGIVLVHGYSGRPDKLAPVSQRLSEQFGQEAVHNVHLPGHVGCTAPAFDHQWFGECIDQAVYSFQSQNRRVVLLGHSTGGILVLDHLLRTDTVPALLILAATPSVIQGADLQLWERHRRNQSDISLLNVARMVSCVNRIGATRVKQTFPVLILQGGADALVSPDHARTWSCERFAGRVQSVVIPDAGHDLFSGPGSDTAMDCVCRAVSDAQAMPDWVEQASIDALQSMDQDAARFLASRPQSVRHILGAPGVLRALKKPVGFESCIQTDPMQANIEITSRCNLSCGHCARQLLKSKGRDMDQQTFRHLLDLMPNTFRMVLVGLGEPTLHPQLVDFVDLASRRGHWVGLVTNAMALEKSLSRHLIASRIGGLTFSLDSSDPDIISKVRQGSDLERIISNIKGFMELSGGMIPTAVFTAVSTQTVRGLQTLGRTVADLGVKAWVLSDLNFQWNLSNSLWLNWNREIQEAMEAAIKTAFSRALPVLSVRGIEELGLARRYRDFLITSPSHWRQRSKAHRWCLSPWQTLPIDVAANATVCDCRPHASLGNLLAEPFSAIWNGAVMQSHRQLMRSPDPSADCLACPRF